MAEELYISQKFSKAEKYQQLLPQLEALVSGENDPVANIANLMAALKQTFNFWWVGVYFVKNEELVLGPFQGPIACTRPLHHPSAGTQRMQRTRHPRP